MAVNVNFYAAWEPVRINAGLGGTGESGLNSGFFINATGLQWSSAVVPGVNDEFGGWLGEFLLSLYPVLATRREDTDGVQSATGGTTPRSSSSASATTMRGRRRRMAVRTCTSAQSTSRRSIAESQSQRSRWLVGGHYICVSPVCSTGLCMLKRPGGRERSVDVGERRS